MSNRRMEAALVAGAALVALGLLVAGLFHPGSTSVHTKISSVPGSPVMLHHHSDHGHVTDQTCVFERNHHKFNGSCQNHFSASVTHVYRACHKCGSRDPQPCHFHPGVVCSALLDFHFHSWGPGFYSLHQQVQAYFDGYHTWAVRSYRGWRGWQRCWSGYGVGISVTDEHCTSHAVYRQDGQNRLQGVDWYYEFRLNLFTPWVPIYRTYTVNMQHWPYPGPAEVWWS